MPNFRASYEAEAMMPRLSPPTAMGFPRNRVSAACSTDAKKAARRDGQSCATWALIGSMISAPASFQCLPDKRLEHALNHQLLRGDEIGILRVLGSQVGLGAF